MGKKPTTATKPARRNPTELLKQEEGKKDGPETDKVRFIAREVKNIYTSDECLLDKDGNISADAMGVVKILSKHANIFVFVVKTAAQRSNSHALKPELRESSRGAVEKYVFENKVSIRFVPVPAEANPVGMKVKYLENVIESASFPIWIVEKKAVSADKDVILMLRRSSNWALVSNEPDATSKDGTIVKVFGITDVSDWKDKVVLADTADTREVIAEKEKSEPVV